MKCCLLAAVSVFFINTPHKDCVLITAQQQLKNKYSIQIKNTCSDSVFYQVGLYGSDKLNGTSWTCIYKDVKSKKPCDMSISTMTLLENTETADFTCEVPSLKHSKYFKFEVYYSVYKKGIKGTADGRVFSKPFKNE
ncbi:hypothetical protein ACFP2F_12865 [Hymenobacter artigasi]|uniref:Uncharacterized protein n=1 Tax=Hymenobacter artigasi TaxID=2719616 RepID=A0ABX1HD72_9BACT|nr:hypothetical protein [Hymenobacter artigasi]NKI88189.1 hypothetical protein [Hymenobacter artigasi]